jgi:gluconokinase
MKYIIGIDIGTGSTKAVAVNTSGDAVHTEQVSYPTLNPEPTYSEQAPELIWQAFIKCIQRTVAALKSEPAAIALSSAMHSLIPVDKNGSPLMNMITWADNRSSSIAKKIKDSGEGDAIYEKSGTPIHAMAPICKIIWLRENKKELFKQVYKFISIKEYIWFNLFGVYEVDHSIASATGLFDIEKLTWSPISLKLCAIGENMLGNPVPVDHIRQGIKDGILNASTDIPFIIGGSDGCMANIGSCAIEPGVAALTIGTSGAIRVANARPTHNHKAMTFNYCLFPNLYISGGPINNGGVALKWYIESFLNQKLDSPDRYSSVLGELDNINAGAEGLIFLPYLLGERAPIWNSDSSGVFFGIRNYHTQAHFTRAVIEGISMALYSIAKAMEESGLSIQKIHASGGFTHTRAWIQILADIFGKEFYLLNSEDASALGAAYLALKKLNLIKEYGQLAPLSSAPITPDMKNHDVYEKTFQLYDRLYKKLKEEMLLVEELRSLK